MNARSQAPALNFLLTYRNLRALFIAGFVIKAILFFIPSFSMRAGGFMGRGGEERSMSRFDLSRVASPVGQSPNPYASIGTVFAFCILITFILLAVCYPRRWVFIAGACVTAIGILGGILLFFVLPNHNNHRFFFPRLLHFVATAMVLSGFWIKPNTAIATVQPTLKDQRGP
jgi:hypothetical protein